MAQFLISQQDNYNGDSNCIAEFLADLYLNFKSDRFYFIVHDKEKDKHIHVILITTLEISKQDLLKIFPKADIQYQRANNKNAFLYLTHQTKKCIRENKTPYEIDSIVRNNITNDFHEKWISIQKEKRQEYQDERELLDAIVDDILDGIINDFSECLRKYKGVALKYSRSINEVISSMHSIK